MPKHLSIFTSVNTTERPDTLCGKIAEGRIGILVDGTPFALIVPYLFIENFQAMDDYTMPPYYASFLRILKYLAFFISLFLPGRTLWDCLAVGSGFGYYSLSSVFITEYRGAELGTVALVANIVREIITLLGAPLLVCWFGRLAPICSGGATTMDTTLPVISRFSGKEFVVVSIFHGFVVDFSVPFLVTFFCKL